MTIDFALFYHKLLDAYGSQGWWPLTAISASGNGEQPTKTGSLAGYHPQDYSYPHTEAQRLEICVGAILTQNTNWANVERAINQLINRCGTLTANALLSLHPDTLKELIRPAGYYNQKATYLRAFAEFFIALAGRTPTRNELLAIKGIGKETADSILLYAYGQPIFVVDAYTKRILTAAGAVAKDAGYDEIQNLFTTALTPNAPRYQEYHALLVEHAKRHYLKTSEQPDPLIPLCRTKSQ